MRSHGRVRAEILVHGRLLVVLVVVVVVVVLVPRLISHLGDGLLLAD